MKRLVSCLLLLACIASVWLPPAEPAAAELARYAAATPTPQEGTPGAAPEAPAKPVDIKPYLDKMTVADKVGQLFLVTFQGTDVSTQSDIAILVRDYRVGGVVLLPVNGNFRDVPVTSSAITTTRAGEAAMPGQISTPEQIARLADALQALAFSPPRPIPPPAAPTITPTVPAITSTVEVVTGTEPALTATVPPETPMAAVTETTQVTQLIGGLPIPLLVGLDRTGDDNSFFSGRGGFTPLPSGMAMGATWTPALTEQVGQVLGQELRSTGVNLLLGPTLDVLDSPRPGNKGDLDVRTFGGDPFWVGQMGQAFIRGVQSGSNGSVVTVAKHFPGQGGSDRRPEDEVATIQKSVQQLRQIELAPFAAVTGGDLSALGTTSALMTAHIRYRGLQGNIRQLSPPISLAPQLQDLMALKEFADWRAAGGVLMSDALGVPALRRYYDPQLQKFPHRQVAQDAFLAGNDLLYLSRFALTDDWPSQFTAIKETILYFQSKYRTDSEFRARVDASVERIIRMKLRIYGGNWDTVSTKHGPNSDDWSVGQGGSVTLSVARAGLTLIYPSRDELADRMPTAPLADENILIFTDARTEQECPACDPIPLISPTALQEIMLRFYGPSATGQIAPWHIRSLTFSDLERLLTAPPGQEIDIEEAIANARWIVFAQLDYDPTDHPESAALRTFLATRSDSLRDKRLVVLAFSAPYYLDTTEISKLTAYFGVYAKTQPFLETAVRALFREFMPIGAPPVSVTGINYDLIRELEPAAGQIVSLSPVTPTQELNGNKANIQVGGRIPLETGVILDRKGHPVPDGTPVEFHLSYPAEALQLAPIVETTTAGRARTTIVLDRPGELWITVQAGEAIDSTRIVLKVGGDSPGTIATVVPTSTPEPTATATAPPTQTPTLEPSPTATSTPAAGASSPAPQLPAALPTFLFALLGVVVSGGMAFALRGHDETAAQQDPRGHLSRSVQATLWAVSVAWVAYLLYSMGWLPGATQLQESGKTWAAGAVTLIGGLLSLLWSGSGAEQE